MWERRRRRLGSGAARLPDQCPSIAVSAWTSADSLSAAQTAEGSGEQQTEATLPQLCLPAVSAVCSLW
jgi:hypothetical protein